MICPTHCVYCCILTHFQILIHAGNVIVTPTITIATIQVLLKWISLCTPDPQQNTIIRCAWLNPACYTDVGSLHGAYWNKLWEIIKIRLWIRAKNYNYSTLYNRCHWNQQTCPFNRGVLLMEVSFVEGSFNIVKYQNGTRKVSLVVRCHSGMWVV